MAATKMWTNVLLLASVGLSIYFIFRGEIVTGIGFLMLAALIDYFKMKPIKNKS